jgi:hypothetical protein
MQITPASLSITQLLGSANEQYVIPAYQRRYSWHEKQLWELLDDISLLEGSDTHLLGSIVCLTGHHKAGMNKLELVDGQQRLTSISILLHCILEKLKEEGQVSEAQDIERLLQAKALGGNPVRKIALDSLDAAEFEEQVSGRQPEHPVNPNLTFAFKTFREWVNGKELSQITTFLYRLQNQAMVIRLDVSDAKDAFKLFETINNRGLRLSPTDIIKNFVLGNAARFGPKALELARSRWAELIRNLDGTSFEAFFRHFMTAQLKRRITVSYVVPNFKTLFMRSVKEAAKLPDRHWYTDEDDADSAETAEMAEESPEGISEPEDLREIKQISFAQFLERLVQSAKIYSDIVLARTGNPKLDRRLAHLRMIKSVQTYGFLMSLRAGGCSDRNLETILALTEAFLFRRHICRERSNENETVFARLCGADPHDPISTVREAYREYCPSDDKFKEEFISGSFPAGLIERARYCLEQIELHQHGKYPELFVGGPDVVHVEHIIPQKIKTRKAKDLFGDWPTYLGSKSDLLHPKYVGRIGNLTLFAGPLNIGASNNPYARKKAAYSDSAIKMTQSLPRKFPEFRFKQVDKRAEEFASLAVKLWPMP